MQTSHAALSYSSITEMVDLGGLDLHFEPRTLGLIMEVRRHQLAG